MARSACIWVVNAAHEFPMATFTVKHELVAYLKKLRDQAFHSMIDIDVSKFHDGERGVINDPMTAVEFLKKEKAW